MSCILGNKVAFSLDLSLTVYAPIFLSGECKQEELCQIEKHMASPSPTFNWKRLSLSTGLRIQPELEKTIPKPHSNTMAYREALSLMRTTPKYSATNNYFPLGEYVK